MVCHKKKAIDRQWRLLVLSQTTVCHKINVTSGKKIMMHKYYNYFVFMSSFNNPIYK